MFETIIIYYTNIFSISKIKIFLSIIFTCFCSTIGGYNNMIEAMYVLLMLDFLFGFIYAFINSNISKKKMQLGLLKLVTYSGALIVFNYASIATSDINFYGIGIKELGVGYLSINEALSCLKHLGNLGVPIPAGLINKLENYRDGLNIGDFKNK